MRRLSLKNTPVRPGKVTLFLLISFPVMVLLLLLPINASRLHHAKVTQEHATEAGVLAAVRTLVDDLRLQQSPKLQVLLTKARRQAAKYARLNPSLGQRLQVDPNLDHSPDGDIVFGSWTNRRFLTEKDLTTPGFLEAIDAVRLTIRRTRLRGNEVSLYGGGFLPFVDTDVVTKATALYDRRVSGFRPVGDNNIPMVPIALRSDPSRSDPLSWEYQVEDARKFDDWRWNRKKQRFLPGADGIPEMRVRLGGDAPRSRRTGRQGSGNRREPNATIVLIGTRTLPQVARQVLDGVGQEDLEQMDPPRTKLVLNAKNELILPGSPFFSETRLLRNVFRTLQSRRGALDNSRVFPLFSGFRNGLLVIRGFVAARVAEVQDPTDGPGVVLVLQPTLLALTNALTEQARPINRYIGRCRLVE
ncbi:MAG: hypothetical protein ACFCD0_24630 [Gemmataceae bacterium]